MSYSYTKLFASITESTVWSEPLAVRVVWVTMLAMVDRYGRVWGSVPGLARRANVTLQECQQALECFLAPDPHSRTPDHDGRRIAPIDGGWRLLNYEKYRELQDEEAQKERNAERQRRFRERQKAAEVPCGTVTERNESNADVTKVTGNNPIASVAVDVAVDAVKKKKKNARTPETGIPENFGISERVRAWAERKGYANLEDHLENFIGQCRAKSYVYADWDDAFMNAIRKDWAEIRSGRNAGSKTNRKLSLSDETELDLARIGITRAA